MKTLRRIEKTCPRCGKQFTRYFSQPKKFCSKECTYENMHENTLRELTKICEICGKVFVKCRKDIPGRFCSTSCSGIASRKSIIRRSGYIYVYMPEHPCCKNKQGYYPEHRIIMEKQLGRYLDAHETPHHINHIRNDNRPENLALMTDKKHKQLHANEQPSTKQCRICGRVKKPYRHGRCERCSCYFNNHGEERPSSL